VKVSRILSDCLTDYLATQQESYPSVSQTIWLLDNLHATATATDNCLSLSRVVYARARGQIRVVVDEHELRRRAFSVSREVHLDQPAGVAGRGAVVDAALQPPVQALQAILEPVQADGADTPARPAATTFFGRRGGGV